MPINVLLADDHAVVRDGLRFLLEAQEEIHVVGVAANGREAVRLVEQHKPDVVVMDIAMPELNGIEATYQIRTVCPAARVVILSMHSSSEHIFRAFQAGAQGYLIKESAGMEVVDAVRTVYAGSRYLSRQIADAPGIVIVQQRQMAQPDDPLERLSPREREILQLLAESNSNAKIADTLSLSPKTVETYKSRLMLKLGIDDLPTLVKFALQHGLTHLE
ncbi:MAG: response regulator transcription factor [Chloroflexi bacterium]|nr:response regulator transcription factor [Chloroflexota bacterium]